VYYILNFNNIKRRSNSKSKKTKIYQNKIESTCFKTGVKNLSQNKEIKEKKVKKMIENYGRINNFQNKEIQEKAEKNIDRIKNWNIIKNILFFKYGIDNPSKVSGVGNRISKSQKERFSKMTEEEKKESTSIARSKVKGFTSKLELKIQNVLNEFKIEYTANKFLFNYNYDIVFQNKIILEIQGDFWHANPNLYNANDLLNFPKKKKYV